MENATKALLIAGSILIAIVLIAVFVRMYGNVAQFQRKQLSAEEAAQIEEFNKDYVKYLDQYVYGTEVVTVINRAGNYQEKTNNSFEIDITFDKNKPFTYIKNGIECTIKGKLKLKKEEGEKYQFIDKNNNAKSLEDLKRRAFKCENIEYDGDYGRVSKIAFIEVEIDDQ